MLKIHFQKKEYLNKQNFVQYVCSYLTDISDFWLRRNDIKTI